MNQPNNGYNYQYNGNPYNNGNHGNGNKSSILDLDENVAATLTAVLPVALSIISHLSYAAWVVPLVVLLLEKRSQFVKLCAAQSLAASAVILLCSVVTKNLDHWIDHSHFFVALPVGIVGLMLSLMQVACLVILVLTAINAYRMKIFEIPTITLWLRRYVGYNQNGGN